MMTRSGKQICLGKNKAGEQHLIYNQKIMFRRQNANVHKIGNISKALSTQGYSKRG